MNSSDPWVEPVRLRPVGIGRYFSAAFLSVWLCGWLVGEVVAAGALGALLVDWIAPDALSRLGFHTRLPSGGGLIFVAGFLCVWLTFWTIGGAAAITALLTMLVGSDELRFDAGRLVLERRIGPFRRVRVFEPGDIRRVFLGSRDQSLRIGLERTDVCLSSLGTPGQRSALRDAMRSRLGLTTKAARTSRMIADGLPEAWESTIDLEGRTVLSRSHGIRRGQAQVMTVITIGLAAMVVFKLLSPDMATGWTAANIGGLAVGIVLTAIAATLTCWLKLGRSGIVVTPSRFALVRSWLGREWVKALDPASLRVSSRRDSDGDVWFDLVARGDRGSHVVFSSMNDSSDVLRLGRWLAGRLDRELQLDSGVLED